MSTPIKINEKFLDYAALIKNKLLRNKLDEANTYIDITPEKKEKIDTIIHKTSNVFLAGPSELTHDLISQYTENIYAPHSLHDLKLKKRDQYLDKLIIHTKEGNPSQEEFAQAFKDPKMNGISIIIDMNRPPHENKAIIAALHHATKERESQVPIIIFCDKSNSIEGDLAKTTEKDIEEALKAINHTDVQIKITSLKTKEGVSDAFDFFYKKNNLKEEEITNIRDRLIEQNQILEEVLIPPIYANMLIFGPGLLKDNFITLHTEHFVNKKVQLSVYPANEDKFLNMKAQFKNKKNIAILIDMAESPEKNEKIIKNYLHLIDKYGEPDISIALFADASKIPAYTYTTKNEQITTILKKLYREDINVKKIKFSKTHEDDEFEKQFEEEYEKEHKIKYSSVPEIFREICQDIVEKSPSESLAQLKAIIEAHEDNILQQLYDLDVPKNAIISSLNSQEPPHMAFHKNDDVLRLLETYKTLKTLTDLAMDANSNKTVKQCANFLKKNRNILLKENIIIRFLEWLKSIGQADAKYIQEANKKLSLFKLKPVAVNNDTQASQYQPPSPLPFKKE